MEEKYIKFLEDKVKQYEKDLRLMLNASKNIDKIKTARIKKEFEDLIAEKIIDIGRMITDFKRFIKDERESENKNV